MIVIQKTVKIMGVLESQKTVFKLIDYQLVFEMRINFLTLIGQQ
jgi:hypothetical protein